MIDIGSRETNSHIGHNGVLFPTAAEHLRRLRDTKTFLWEVMLPGRAYELRAIASGGRGKVRRQLFDDPESLLLTAHAWNQKQLDIYMTVNPAVPNAKVNSRRSLGDDDIDRVRWMLFDLDPPREPGTLAATDEQRALALDQFHALMAFLPTRGWPGPSIVFQSGNGFWAMNPLNQDNIPKNTEARAGFLRFIKEKFPMVDCSVYNASRIVRVPGTLNWKCKLPAELIEVNGEHV